MIATDPLQTVINDALLQVRAHFHSDLAGFIVAIVLIAVPWISRMPLRIG